MGKQNLECDKYCGLIYQLIENKFYDEAEMEIDKVIVRMQANYEDAEKLRFCLVCLKSKIQHVEELPYQLIEKINYI